MTRAFLVVLAALPLVACGKRDESLTKKAGAQVGETMHDFASGVGAGIDRGSALPVELTPAVTELGLTKTVSKWEKRSLFVYVVSKDKTSTTLLAKVLNGGGEEIGRCKVEVALDRDDAKYVKLDFPAETDTKLVARCVIDVAK